MEFWWIRDESPGWNKGELRFRDPVSGEFLQTYEEIQDAVEDAEAQAESAEAQAEAAEVRMAEMESELRRLRGQ